MINEVAVTAGVRLASIDDFTRLQEIMRAANQFSIDESGLPMWKNLSIAIPALHKHIEDNECYVIDEGKVRAAVCICETDEMFWGRDGLDGCAIYMHKLMRDPKMTVKGDGRRLIRFVAQEADRRSRSFIRCDTNDYQAQLITYYEQLGFEAKRKIMYKATGTMAVLLETEVATLKARLTQLDGQAGL